jgi:hypothetical protein
MAVSEETGGRGGLSALEVYVAVLGLTLVAILVGTGFLAENFGTSIVQWVAFTLLFAMSESVDTFFHHERGRQSLNPSVSVLLPMIVSLSFPEVVWGVAIAVAGVSAIHWREGALKFVFNVSQYACATAVAAAIWQAFGKSGAFGIRDAAVAAMAVLVFEGLTHLFVARAISFAEERSFAELLRTITPMALPYFAGNILIGLVLAAAYEGAATQTPGNRATRAPSCGDEDPCCRVESRDGPRGLPTWRCRDCVGGGGSCASQDEQGTRLVWRSRRPRYRAHAAAPRRRLMRCP